MPKQKQFLNAGKKKGTKSNSTPQTADEFLAAGVEQEEGGEKWRAGDAAKSARFFLRAIETYVSGLQIFPQSFDLAYNKARLQYDLTQQPRLMRAISTSLEELLQLALASHERALILSPDNTDALFNTAQVLTSQAELISEKKSDEQKPNALQLLAKATEVLKKCYDLQEAQLIKQEHEPFPVDSASQSSGSDYDSHNAVAEEQWASVVEPITGDTVIDTTAAQIDVLTSMCGLTPLLSAHELDQIKDTASAVFRHQDAFSANATNRQGELFLGKANFTIAFLDAAFRYNLIDIPVYEAELKDAFASVLEPSFETPQARCDHADALLVFYTALATTVDAAVLSLDERNRISHLQWTLLSSALSDLSRALALPNVQNVARIHMRRGDCELLRYRMGEHPVDYKPAASNSATLLKNAATYYRGSMNAARVEGAEDGASEAMVKEAIVNSLSNNGKVEGLAHEALEKAGLFLEEMKSEGLVSEDCFRSLTA